MERATLSIEGMHCGKCVDHVTRVLSGLPGVSVERVEVGSAHVAYDEAKVEPRALREAVAAAGYQATVTATARNPASCATAPKQGSGGGGCCH